MEKYYGLVHQILEAQRRLLEIYERDPEGYLVALVTAAEEHIEDCVERDK